MLATPMTVVETARFLKDVKPLLSQSEREELVAFVGANPEAGEIIPETGGVRKIRWALAGRGKRGGARVIYYWHNERLLFLLAAYGKNDFYNSPTWKHTSGSEFDITGVTRLPRVDVVFACADMPPDLIDAEKVYVELCALAVLVATVFRIKYRRSVTRAMRQG